MHDSNIHTTSDFRLTEESGSSTAPTLETRKRSRNEQDVTSTCIELFARHEQIAASFRHSDKHKTDEKEDGTGALPNGLKT
jgi:argininosuccinate lyase